MKAGLKKVNSLCKKHLFHQVWAWFWTEALFGLQNPAFQTLA